MTQLNATALEQEGLMEAARAMCVAARTAPKARGTDNLAITVLTGEEKEKLAREMQRIFDEKGIAIFGRDAANIRQAGAVVIIGTRLSPLNLPSCGFCGHADCKACEAIGGICAVNAGDLGIALGSAAGVAADRRVDCRVMFTVGRASINLGILGADVRIAYGLPLSAGPKNPFFDRK
jgi:uncharacterized ferredoxin-like protein